MGNAHSALPHDPLESAVTHPIAPVANEIDKVIGSLFNSCLTFDRGQLDLVESRKLSKNVSGNLVEEAKG